MNPKYPVYIISKGRWESRMTSKALEKIKVPYYIVVEPQEYDKYAAVIASKKILVLPFSNLGQGSIPARNWVWEHSISIGAERHWMLDDNLRVFYRLNRNIKYRVGSGTIFRVIEDFVDRYENIGISGMEYELFIQRKEKVAPYRLNTRVYSCILIKNDIPFRWRGRYNEDTDLSIRVLKAGWCTILFQAFLCDKMPTMSMKGGNTEELYKDDGRLKMAQSLQEQHPDVVKITKKWGRWQHQVDYRPFKGNKLIKRLGVFVQKGVNNYGMVLKNIGEPVQEIIVHQPQAIEQGAKRRCDGCRFSSKIVRGEGPELSDLVVVGEGPGKQEMDAGLPFLGVAPSGKLLNKCLKGIGFDRKDVYVTNAFLCGGSHRPKELLGRCRRELIGEVKQRKPKVILALGAVASKCFGDTAKGEAVWVDEVCAFVVSAYHPAFVLRNKFFKGKLLEQFDTAAAAMKPMEDVDYWLVDTWEKFESLQSVLVNTKKIAVDVETTGLDRDDKLLGIGICWERGRASYIPIRWQSFFGELDLYWGKRSEWEVVDKFLSDLLSRARSCFHNAKFDLRFLSQSGVESEKVKLAFDTMLASHVLDCDLSHRLESLGKRKFPAQFGRYKEETSEAIKKKGGLLGLTLKQVTRRCCGDADLTFRLAEQQAEELAAKGLDGLFYNFSMPMVKFLLDVENTGVQFDVERAKVLSEALGEQIRLVEEKVFRVVGERFLISSDQQLGMVLKKIGVPLRRKTAKGQVSVDEDALLPFEGKFPIVRKILEYRGLRQLKSTFVDGVLPRVDSLGRLHTTFSQHVTPTGRLSSEKPNLQNVPTMRKDKRFRPLYIAGEGKKLVCADYAQEQLRILAWYSKDASLLAAFESGEDIHLRTGADIFGKDIVSISSEQRQQAKGVNFGVIFGQSAQGLAEALGVTEAEATKFLDRYFKVYDGVKAWVKAVEDFVLKNGYVANAYGRVRPLPWVVDEKKRQEAYRKAVNTLVQGTAADYANYAMVRVGKALREGNYGARVVLLEHDEIVIEVPIEEVEKVVPVIREGMIEPILPVDIKMEVDIKVVDNWGED